MIALVPVDTFGLRLQMISGLNVTDEYGTTRDVMRGEETETIGLQHLLKMREGAFVLPGSHSKLVYTDASGRITDFETMMTGEMVSALSSHTILRQSVSLGSLFIRSLPFPMR